MEKKTKLMVNLGASGGSGGGGTEIVANPTLSGSEAALTGLQVGDAKFKVSSGHCYNCYFVDDNYYINFLYFTNAVFNVGLITADIKNDVIKNSRSVPIVQINGDYIKNNKLIFGLSLEQKITESIFRYNVRQIEIINGNMTSSESYVSLSNVYCSKILF